MSANTHFQRILTALFLLPLLITAVWLHGTLLTLVLFLVAVLGLNEFYTFFWPTKKGLFIKSLGILCTFFLIWAPLAWPGEALLIPIWVLCALLFLCAYSRNPHTTVLTDSQILVSGLLYVPFLLRLARSLSTTEIIFLLLATFATDTGAFYAGRQFGGPKIWPNISPKKTWAGSVGGCALCTTVCIFFGSWYGQASWPFFLLAGLCLNIAAQVGDFFESALKRKQGIKDSGRILPGHGGILDRIDSLLFVLPTYYALQANISFFQV